MLRELGAIGQFVGPLFYLLLAVAALSSMISILEPSVLWVQERMPTTRTRATFIVIAICIILCLISVSGFNVLKDFKKLNSLSATDGETDIKILLEKDNEILTFNLKNKRKVNYKLLNSLNLTENVIIE